MVCLRMVTRRVVGPEQAPLDKDSLATVHDPEHPCGIMSMSNVAMNTMGKFTNTRRDFFADKQVGHITAAVVSG